MGLPTARCLPYVACLALLLSFAGCGGGGGSTPLPGTNNQPPIASTLAATNVTADAATLNGDVNPNGNAASAWFEWSTNPALITYSATVSQPIGSGVASVAVNAALTGLSPGTTYYYRVCASSGAGQSKGNIASFTAGTPAAPPTVQTLGATGITTDNATLNGSVNPNGIATTAWFEWGTDPALATYAATASQSIGSGVAGVAVNTTLAGLSATTTYYYRACGSSSAGERKGAIAAFTTASPYLSGPDVGQYFDRAVQAPGPQNYADNSSHPLRGLTTGDAALLYGAQGSENCLHCHYDSGSTRTSDECLKCHFENQGSGPTPGALDPVRHMNGTIELAALSGDSLPASQHPIAAITDYDAWCLQCHEGTGMHSLGGIFPSDARKTLFPAGQFANSRHRVSYPGKTAIGCIYCHHPHGRTNTRIVRENPRNRWTAGGTPLSFGVFPADTLGGPAYNYRSRVDGNIADADDDNRFCNLACHNASKPQDKLIVRDNMTGNYILTPDNKKQYLVSGYIYTIDNAYQYPKMHQHPNNEVIPTDNMIQYWSLMGGVSGPTHYRYPGGSGSDPSLFGPVQNLASPLPFFPDYPDGNRDFTNGYIDLGLIRYRFTCSTCHNPHGTTLANTPADSGYPDLRLPRKDPNALCEQCHL